MPSPLADAALLAAQAPAGGGLSPRHAEVGPAWLDLRGVGHEVGQSRLEFVARALGPCLSLQASARLLVSAGEVDPLVASQRLGEAFVRLGLPELRIAAVRGEDVLPRLEEFLVAGCALRSDQPPHPSLHDERRRPAAATAEAPASTLREALDAGAQVVVAQTAAEATVCAALGDPHEPEGQRDVTIRFVASYGVVAVVDDPRPSAELNERLRSHLPADCELSCDEAGDVKVLRLTSPSRDTFDDACRRCELLLQGVVTPLDNLATVAYDQWRCPVPTDLLEFGFELQSAAEWGEG